MAEWKRCFLRTIDSKDELEVDLLIENGRVCFGQAYFGVWRNVGGAGELWPLMFISDNNAVDHGSEYGGEKERYGRMKLHGEPIQKGSGFAYAAYDYICDFIVDDLKSLTKD